MIWGRTKKTDYRVGTNDLRINLPALYQLSYLALCWLDLTQVPIPCHRQNKLLFGDAMHSPTCSARETTINLTASAHCTACLLVWARYALGLLRERDLNQVYICRRSPYLFLEKVTKVYL